MEKRITWSLFAMGLLATIVTVLFVSTALYQKSAEQRKQDIKDNTFILANSYDADNIESIAEITGRDFSLRITLIAPDGEVLLDNKKNTAELENHSDRPEVVQAISSGFGEAERESETFGRDEYYYAYLLEDGNVLRVSTETYNLYGLLGESVYIIIAIIVVLMILSILFAITLTGKLLKPIHRLTETIVKGDYKDAENDIYDELVPFTEALILQQDEIRKQQKERERLEKIRQDFTANVSHELKTPLTSISGYAEMIETGLAKDEDIQRFSSIIHRESGRMLTLISDIITLSQLDATDSKIDMEEVSLSQIAHECIDILKINADKRGITMHVEGSEGIVYASRVLMTELIYNLCDNAIRYNKDNGKISILIGEKSITVQDTGIGIPKALTERVFERFYRVDKSHSRQTGGTGLGLAIVKHIVEQHNAKLKIDSIEGEGTTICVEFAD